MKTLSLPLLALALPLAPLFSQPVNAPFPPGETKDTAPKATPFVPPPEDLAGLRVARNVAYHAGPDRDPEGFQSLDITAPGNGADLPVLIFVHGGGWTRSPGRPVNQGRSGPFSAGFARRGYVVVSVGYRLSPQHVHPAHIEDCARAFAWVRANIAAHGGSPDKIFLFGHSAGAHLAALLATNPRFLAAVGESTGRIRGVVPISGTYWIDAGTKGGTVFGPDPAVHLDASPGRNVRRGVPPLLLVCGDHYPWEPFLVAPSTKLRDLVRAAGSPADFHQIADRDHGTIYSRLTSIGDETTALMEKFFQARLAAASPPAP